MAQSCPKCKSGPATHVGSHRSFISATEYKEIQYYECKNCGNKFAVEI